MGTECSLSQHPQNQCVSVHLFQKLVVPAEEEGGRGQGEACLKGTCRGTLSHLPEPLGKGALDMARFWSMPGASSRCGTPQILITHSWEVLSRRGTEMAGADKME